MRDQWLRDVSLTVRSGEIVGLSGLDGQGQQELLRFLWRNRAGRHSVRFRGGVSFVTGDRQTRGIFPLWNLGLNISVGVLKETAPRGVVQRAREKEIVADWLERLAVRGTASTPVGDLSGGNQQKALIARALAAASRMVLLDDPFRGVDVETKQQVYRLMREETARGRVSCGSRPRTPSWRSVTASTSCPQAGSRPNCTRTRSPKRRSSAPRSRRADDGGET